MNDVGLDLLGKVELKRKQRIGIIKRSKVIVVSYESFPMRIVIPAK